LSPVDLQALAVPERVQQQEIEQPALFPRILPFVQFHRPLLSPGLPNTLALAEHAPLLELLRARHGAGEPVAAICAAPLVLDRAGVLEPGGFTCYPGIEARLHTPRRQDATVVERGGVTTSQGPTTAMAFALHLVELLEGPALRAQVADGLLQPQA
jgi:4-methyl-5(b-hydroxyethyl)-thiazole monophosphate biosynthesis